MVKLQKEKTKALVALHGWSAVILGFLLFAVVATGTVAVFAEQIRHWSVGHVSHSNPLQADLDSIVARLANEVEPEFLEEIGIGHSPKGELQLFFHTHRKKDNGEIEDYGVQYNVDPYSGEVLDQKLGTGVELFQSEQSGALSRFLVNIHTELHLPRPWGLLLTGILGLAMLVAAISGFMMHRHLFADIFVLRRDRSKVLKRRDIHTVAGTWGLPFAFILAFTGSFFSFAGSFGLPAMAMVAFGGDQEAMVRTLIGVPATESDESIKTASLNKMIDDAASRQGAIPEFATVSHYNRGDAKITLFLPAADNKLEPVQMEYSGVSGEFQREKPQVGTQPSVGSAVFSVIGPLHFGHFAGLLSRFVWLALGFASCYVIVSGFALWVARRREEDPRWLVLERYNTIFSFGLPLAMLCCAGGYFLALMFAQNTITWVATSFCVVSVICLLSGIFIKDNKGLKRNLLSLNALLCFCLPLLRVVSDGPGWREAIRIGNPEVIMVDLLLLLLAGLIVVSKIKQGKSKAADLSIEPRAIGSES